MEAKTYACDQCHDPSIDRQIGFAFLPLGQYAEAKKHFQDVHGLFLSEEAITFADEEGARLWEAERDRRNKEQQTIQSGKELLDFLKS